jgi:hypothetical protein
MAEKRHEQSSFTVTDRRLFNSEGELRNESTEEVEPSKAAPAITQPEPAVAAASPQQIPSPSPAAVPTPVDSAVAVQGEAEGELPPPPTAEEQSAQADAYHKSSKALDSQVELNGHSAKEFEMTFERFLASLYMTAMLQLGLMRQQGEQPRIDIIGARQTIDTLSLIAEKTKNNLTPVEDNFLHNSLYEVRMAYVEVTNALTHPPLAGPATGTGGK